MIDADALTRNYFESIGQAPDGHLDGPYQFQMTYVRETVRRLAAILDGEGIGDEQAARIVRSMLCGAPSEAEARLRMQQAVALRDMAVQQPARFHLSDLYAPPSRA